MLNAQIHKTNVTPSTKTPAHLRLLVGTTSPALIIAASTAQLNHQSKSNTSYVHTAQATASTNNAITYYDNIFSTNTNDDSYLESYLNNIQKSLGALETNGFVEIPKEISNADEFYAWLHKE